MKTNRPGSLISAQTLNDIGLRLRHDFNTGYQNTDYQYYNNTQ